MKRRFYIPQRPSPHSNGTHPAAVNGKRPLLFSPQRAAALIGLSLDELRLLSRIHGIGRPPLRQTDSPESGPYFTPEELLQLAQHCDPRCH